MGLTTLSLEDGFSRDFLDFLHMSLIFKLSVSARDSVVKTVLPIKGQQSEPFQWQTGLNVCVILNCDHVSASDSGKCDQQQDNLTGTKYTGTRTGMLL